MINKIELLAPAGDLERLKLTLLYGADAVYIGGQEYSLRANATNFSIPEIKEACSFAHKLGKKVYLTTNIVFHNEDIVGVYDYLNEVYQAGIDAFIVSDPFIINYIKEHFKEAEIHVSTQNSTTNIESVKFFLKQGVKRVVLARELSKTEIQEIIAKTGMDIEVFIHGAMCTFFSGRCALSNYLTNRDSNRGGCSQVCRFHFDIDSSSKEKFTMATKDLNMAHYIKDLMEIGVKSLKIEGRMRSHYYLATVVSSYRKLIDAINNDTLSEELIEIQEQVLSRVSNRENSTHYFFHEANGEDQYYTGRQELSNQDYLGYVIDYDKIKKEVIVSERNLFKLQDEVEIFMPSGKIISFIIEHIYTEQGEELEVARHPEEILRIPCIEEVEKASMMRIKVVYND
ncbi:MAG: U32 family peptidase [Bacilli bacterium]